MPARQMWKQRCKINSAIVVLESSAATPDQANAHCRLFSQLLCPKLNLVSTGLQVSVRIWNGVEGRLESQRQRQQWAVIVKGRQRTSLFHKLTDTGKPLQQSDEPLRRLENDVRACFGYQFCITAKLNRIA